MKTSNSTHKILLTSLVTAISVGSLNTATALIAYHSFMPKKPVPENESLISTSVEQNTAVPTQSSSQPPSTSPGVPVSTGRKLGGPIAIGQTPQPTAIINGPSGQVKKWCSGTNPQLEEGVCEAVMSIAANPTSSNPHLGEKARRSLSLLPKDSSLSLDESSWSSTSSSSGSMLVTLHTSSYGDVKLKVLLEKTNGIWVVNDGQLA